MALRREHDEILVHTGQHYDPALSDVFFDELGLPKPDHRLESGSGAHGEQTASMLVGLERLMMEHTPDVVIVFGDTNSTLAGALAASKLHLPIAHVEAGLRSFNRRMPEEVNRVVTDHLSRWLFAPSEAARGHLASEGITRGVEVVGDIMLDAYLQHQRRAGERASLPSALGLAARQYYLCTLHRAENTDEAGRLGAILGALGRLDAPVVLPLHPRTQRKVREWGLRFPETVRLLEPVGYLDMLSLEANARCVLTDSGGIQKEAYYAGVPCVTLRDETEWTETIEAGWNTLAGADPEAIVSAVARMACQPGNRPPLYGSGDAASRIVQVLAGVPAGV